MRRDFAAGIRHVHHSLVSNPCCEVFDLLFRQVKVDLDAFIHLSSPAVSGVVA